MNRTLTLAIVALVLCLFVFGCFSALEKPLDPRRGEPPPAPPQDDDSLQQPLAPIGSPDDVPPALPE